MLIFEILLGLILGAILLSKVARRLNIPYPTLLALAGALVAFLPNAPKLDLPPELILALFVAPILLDAAYDTSLRDLRVNWRPVLSLVLAAVGLTTIAVAATVHTLLPGFPWAAAVALGALLAPPDAVAALAVMRQVAPPHRIRTVLEGESLLNDASALIIYKLAVTTVVVGNFNIATAVPTLLAVAFGSLAAGWLLARLIGRLIGMIDDAPSSVILQFVSTFGVWVMAERIGLSPVITIVVYALTMARSSAPPMPARLRVPSFAIWEAATFVLNVLAFTLIGLQIRPIYNALEPSQRGRLLLTAGIVLVVVIGVRLLWVMIYVFLQRRRRAPTNRASSRISVRSGLVIGWSGMRGIVTLAAAMALPFDFPYRGFIQLTAFVVVLGTLVIQGLTLRPLLLLLRLPSDDTVDREVNLARATALEAGIKELGDDPAPAAQRLRENYEETLRHVRGGKEPHSAPNKAQQLRVVAKSREAILELRSSGAIGDDAYHLVEEELDWLDLTARPPETTS